MKRQRLLKSSISQRIKITKLWQRLQKFVCGLCFALGIWLIFTTITLISVSSQPVNGLFVLGGSIQREIYVAEAAKRYPQIPILISQGSPDPCVWLIFQREAADLSNVWLEKCADSTWGNFYYGITILRRWGVTKVTLITSQSHLPRAKWIAQILFGANRIWVDVEVVPERGVPGNRESWLKTGLDVTRSLLWAVFSPIIQPQCSQVIRLADVDMSAWELQGFKCERQGNLER
ncbi:YdcF family protein [Fortiea contorta]|uniref:YdcF family protein n=1 Tax=Fortiea contorta TaxID=1892405 RepID=UPI00034DA15C|nr:YdcF family protein [Fortiea contorta]